MEWSYKENSPWLLAGLKDPQNKIVFQAHGYFDKDNSGTYKNGYTEVDYRKRFLPFLEWCRTNNVKGLIIPAATRATWIFLTARSSCSANTE